MRQLWCKNVDAGSRSRGRLPARAKPVQRGTHRPGSVAPVRAFCVVSVVAITSLTLPAVRAQDRPNVDEPGRSDEELGKRLVRKALADADEDLMAGILRLMDEAARKLEIDFDTGDETQAVQQRIMDQLDEAIKVASVRRRVRSVSGECPSGDKRRRSTGERDRSEDSSGSSRDDEDSSTSDTVGETGSAAQGDRAGGDLHESRRTWGHLPQRERDEVIQGIGETYLERYRAWIERYYRALQESQE